MGEIIIHHIIFGQGEDIIFLHGWGGDKNSFLFLAKLLSKNFRVTIVELPGFGETKEPTKPYRLDDYVKSVMEIVHSYKMNDFTLICHSFGGRIGLKFAYKYGYMVKKLVLIDSAGMKPRRHLRYYLSIIRHRVLTKMGIPHQAGSRDYRVLSPIMKKTFVNIVKEHLDLLIDRIFVPTLLIWGNKDKETPIYMGKRILRYVKDCGMVILEGCGHFSYVEKPNLVFAIISSFLKGEYVVDNGRHYLSYRNRRIVRIPDCSAK